MRLAGGVLQYTRTRELLLDYQPNCFLIQSINAVYIVLYIIS